MREVDVALRRRELQGTLRDGEAEDDVAERFEAPGESPLASGERGAEGVRAEGGTARSVESPMSPSSQNADTLNMSDLITLDAADDLARRSAVLPDDHVLVPDDADLVAFLLGGQHCSFSVAADGRLTWRGFGGTFQTLGELRTMAREHPSVPREPALPEVTDGETVGIELFGNMLDTIAFLPRSPCERSRTS